MSTRAFRRSWWLSLAAFTLASGCLQQSSTSPERPLAISSQEPDGAAGSISQTGNDESSPSPDPSSDRDISAAPVTPILEEKLAPANLKISPSLDELLSRAESGAEEAALLELITNSTGTFNLGSDEIIYLNDLGMPGNLITAMIKRDHYLGGVGAATAAPALDLDFANPQPSLPTADFEAPSVPSLFAQPSPEPFPASNPGVADNLEPAPGPVPDGDFHDALAPYGQWVNVQGYGRCWQPTAVVTSRSWQPYFDHGCWVFSDCGWYWKSDYSWGWAPFHYGRWFRHARLGWCWRPDGVWGPAWVCWRASDLYCGWAPLPPGATYRFGIGLCFNGRRARPDCDFGLGAHCFRFTDVHHFQDRNLAHHAVRREHSDRTFHHTTASTRILGNLRNVTNLGVPRGRIAAATHAELRTVALREAKPQTGVISRERFEPNGRSLAVYRPQPAPKSKSGDDRFSAAGDPAARLAGRSGTTVPRPPATETTSVPVARGQPLILPGPARAPAGSDHQGNLSARHQTSSQTPALAVIHRRDSSHSASLGHNRPIVPSTPALGRPSDVDPAIISLRRDPTGRAVANSPYRVLPGQGPSEEQASQPARSSWIADPVRNDYRESHRDRPRSRTEFANPLLSSHASREIAPNRPASAPQSNPQVRQSQPPPAPSPAPASASTPSSVSRSSSSSPPERGRSR